MNKRKRRKIAISASGWNCLKLGSPLPLESRLPMFKPAIEVGILSSAQHFPLGQFSILSANRSLEEIIARKISVRHVVN